MYVLVGVVYWFRAVAVSKHPVDRLDVLCEFVRWNKLEADKPEQSAGDRKPISAVSVDPADNRLENIHLIRHTESVVRQDRDKTVVRKVQKVSIPIYRTHITTTAVGVLRSPPIMQHDHM